MCNGIGGCGFAFCIFLVISESGALCMCFGHLEGFLYEVSVQVCYFPFFLSQLSKKTSYLPFSYSVDEYIYIYISHSIIGFYSLIMLLNLSIVAIKYYMLQVYLCRCTYSIFSKIRNKTRIPTFTIFVQHSFGSLSHTSQRRKRKKKNQNWKGNK